MARLVEYSDEGGYEFEVPFGRPVIPARISNPINGASVERLMLVDSGADTSAVPAAFLEDLGVDVRNAARTTSAGTAGPVQAIVVELLYEVGGIRAIARTLVPMAPTFDSYILGREPFFRLLHFGFAQYPEPNLNRVLWRDARHG